MHRCLIGLLVCAVASASGGASAQPSAQPSSLPPTSPSASPPTGTSGVEPSASSVVPRRWSVGATASVFTGVSPHVERDYSGTGIALQAGYRVRPGATLLARVAWTHSREV